MLIQLYDHDLVSIKQNCLTAAPRAVFAIKPSLTDLNGVDQICKHDLQYFNSAAPLHLPTSYL